jgi:ABC-type transport system involved in multi-copper enzyme maturation permease subunit
MDWPLPDRLPIFWHEVQRRVLRRNMRNGSIIAVLLGIQCVVALPMLMLKETTGFDVEFWRRMLAVMDGIVLLLAPGLAVSAVTAERERGSLDFLFLTPLSPRAILLQKLVAAAVLLLAALLCFFPFNLLTAWLGHVPAPTFALGWAHLLARATAVLCVGLMVSALARHTRTATIAVYVGIAAFAYVLNPLLAPLLAARLASLTAPWLSLIGTAGYLAAALLVFAIAVGGMHRLRHPSATAERLAREANPTSGRRWYLPDNNPVFWDDLRRRLRGRRSYEVMLGFVGVLCGIFFTTCLLVKFGAGQHAWAEFGESVFLFALIGQFLLILIISPGLTATTFSSERESRQIDFLLLAPITARQLVLQKFWSAMAVLLLVLICGIPVVAIIAATFGGIAPEVLLLGYAGLVLAGLFSATTSLLYSIKAKNSSAALVQGYLVSWVGVIGATALVYACFIGPILAFIEIFRNLHYAVRRLDNWRRDRDDSQYTLPMMQEFETPDG